MLNLLTKNARELEKIAYGKKKLKRLTTKGLNFQHKAKGYREIVLRNQSVDQ